MNWTKEKPTKSGWYWYLDGEEIQIVMIDDNRVWFAGWEIGYPVDGNDGEWYGPIEPPKR